ncbi:hypothetical protein Tco_0944312, partial [Tanacetum coccineum]
VTGTNGEEGYLLSVDVEPTSSVEQLTSLRIHDMFMKYEPSNWDNGLRICGKDMIAETGQKHGKRHRTFAFVYDFLHSINDHRSEVELSSNGQKLSLSGSRSGDGLFDVVMFRTKEIAIGMIIKRV